MKKPDFSESDDQLNKALSEWKVYASLPPRFQESVWRQIEKPANVPSPITSVVSRLTAWVPFLSPRPSIVIAYIALFLSVGVTLGWKQADQANKRIKDELGERYVRSLDPYLSPRP